MFRHVPSDFKVYEEPLLACETFPEAWQIFWLLCLLTKMGSSVKEDCKIKKRRLANTQRQSKT